MIYREVLSPANLITLLADFQGDETLVGGGVLVEGLGEVHAGYPDGGARPSCHPCTLNPILNPEQLYPKQLGFRQR